MTRCFKNAFNSIFFSLSFIQCIIILFLKMCRSFTFRQQNTSISLPVHVVTFSHFINMDKSYGRQVFVCYFTWENCKPSSCNRRKASTLNVSNTNNIRFLWNVFNRWLYIDRNTLNRCRFAHSCSVNRVQIINKYIHFTHNNTTNRPINCEF